MIRQSDVLKKYMEFEGIPADVLRQAAERGTAIHRLIAADLQDIWTPDYSDDMLQGYLESFLHFRPMIRRIWGIEKTFENVALGVSGTIDLLAEIDGRPGVSVIDWKTSVIPAKVWSAQMAIYKHLSGADNCGTVQLRDDGGPPKLIWWDNDRYALGAFFSALNSHRYFLGE